MVLAETYSVIRTQAIKTDFKGAYEAFLRNLPNQTHCSDSELDHVGFTVWEDMINYAKLLVDNGLIPKKNYTLYNRLKGPIVESDWLERARLAWFKDSPEAFTFALLSAEYSGREEHVAKYPKGWSTINSIKSTDCTTEGEFKKRFHFLKEMTTGFVLIMIKGHIRYNILAEQENNNT